MARGGEEFASRLQGGLQRLVRLAELGVGRGDPPAAAPKGQEVEAQKSNRDGEAAQDDQDNPVPRPGELCVFLKLIRLQARDFEVLVGKVELCGYQRRVGVDHQLSGFVVKPLKGLEMLKGNIIPSDLGIDISCEFVEIFVRRCRFLKILTFKNVIKQGS